MIYLYRFDDYNKISDLAILLNQLNILFIILIFFVVSFWTYFLINSVLERKN